MTMIDEFKYARPEGQQRRRDAYGALYDDALGTIVPPEMGAKGTQGPEGQLWQGLAQQQAFAQAQAGRRGYDPSMARGASQANAELESQGYGAAAGIREQQAAYARKAKLGLLQQRGAQDMAQSGIEGQQLGQSYSDYAFNQQAKDDLQAKKEADETRTRDAVLGAVSGAASVVGKVVSDERQKKNMKDGGMAADKLMAALAMPQNRAAAKRYYNTPAGYALPSSDNGPAAEFQRLGNENGVSAGDDEIEQLQRMSDEHDADTTSAADIKAARLRALTASLNERDRTVAGDAPNPADVAGKPVRGADGVWMMPTQQLMADEAPNPADVAGKPVRLADGSYMMPTQQLMASMAMPKRRGDVQLPPDAITAKAPSRYTEAERAMANEHLGIRRAIDPRAAAYVAKAMPTQFEGVSDDEYGAAPEKLAQFFNERAAQFEGKARAPEATKRAEVVSSFDDYATQAALEATKPKSFDYKTRVGIPGRQLGVTAQDMAANPTTAPMVVSTPQGLALDPAKATGPLLAMTGQLGKRVKKLEARK